MGARRDSETVLAVTSHVIPPQDAGARHKRFDVDAGQCGDAKRQRGSSHVVARVKRRSGAVSDDVGRTEIRIQSVLISLRTLHRAACPGVARAWLGRMREPTSRRHVPRDAEGRSAIASSIRAEKLRTRRRRTVQRCTFHRTASDQTTRHRRILRPCPAARQIPAPHAERKGNCRRLSVFAARITARKSGSTQAGMQNAYDTAP